MHPVRSLCFDPMQLLSSHRAQIPFPYLTPPQCDLNGDGSLEVISVTHDHMLQLLKPQPPGRAGDGFAPATVVAQVSLLPQKISIGSDRRPVRRRYSCQSRLRRVQCVALATAARVVLCLGMYSAAALGTLNTHRTHNQTGRACGGVHRSRAARKGRRAAQAGAGAGDRQLARDGV